MMEGPRHQHLHQEWQEPLEEPAVCDDFYGWAPVPDLGGPAFVLGKGSGMSRVA